jgi:uncharacterized protein with FMN-binding domain
MKKSIVVILAVAIIGALGAYSKAHKSVSGLTSPFQTGSASQMSATPVSSSNSTMPMSQMPGSFKDGTYAGQTEDTAYGPVQISLVISGGKITNVNFLRMPSDRAYSQQVTAYVEPLLKQSTLSKQSAHIDFVSGATSTSEAYAMSLQAALDRAV